MNLASPSASPSRQPLWYRAVGLLSLTVFVAGIGGLSLVWLRQQISDTATRIAQVQRERVEVERRMEYLSSRIAEMHRPDHLLARASAAGLALTRPAGRQIVRLGPIAMPGEETLLATSAAGEESAETEPYRQTFDLAVMEPVRAFRP